MGSIRSILIIILLSILVTLLSRLSAGHDGFRAGVSFLLRKTCPLESGHGRLEGRSTLLPQIHALRGGYSLAIGERHRDRLNRVDHIGDGGGVGDITYQGE